MNVLTLKGYVKTIVNPHSRTWQYLPAQAQLDEEDKVIYISLAIMARSSSFVQNPFNYQIVLLVYLHSLICKCTLDSSIEHVWHTVHNQIFKYLTCFYTKEKRIL